MTGWPFQWGYLRVAWAFFWLGYDMSPQRSWARQCRALARFVALAAAWWWHGDIGPALDRHGSTK